MARDMGDQACWLRQKQKSSIEEKCYVINDSCLSQQNQNIAL